ncbi:hypothetical protein Lser_V15G05330 [Lactuca serriola]
MTLNMSELFNRRWEPVSMQQRHGSSIVEVCRIIEETVDQFFALKIPMRSGEMNSLFRGIDNALQVYSKHVVDNLLRVETVAVFVGPVSYLLLSKLAKGVEKTFDLLSLLDKILPIYKEAGATWIQVDVDTLVKDLEGYQLKGFTNAYSELESACSGHNVIVANYFADIPAEAFKTLTSLHGVSGFTFDFIRGEKALDLIKSSFPSGKYLFAGVVDGRNIWANDLVGSLAGHKNEAFFSANAVVQVSRKSSPRVTNESLQKAVWNVDVRFYRIKDLSGKPISYFCFDRYSRPAEKRGGAWMDEVVARSRIHQMTKTLFGYLFFLYHLQEGNILVEDIVKLGSRAEDAD